MLKQFIRACILFLMFTTSQTSHAQLWVKKLGWRGYPDQLLHLDNGDILISGRLKYDISVSPHDSAFLLCADSTGEPKWIKRFALDIDTSEVSYAYIVPLKDGYIYRYTTYYWNQNDGSLYTYVFFDKDFNVLIDSTPIYDGKKASTFFQEIESDSTLLFKCKDEYCTYIARTDNNFNFKETVWYPDPGFGIPSIDKPRRYLMVNPQTGDHLLWDDHTNTVAANTIPDFPEPYPSRRALKNYRWLLWQLYALNIMKLDSQLSILWSAKHEDLIPFQAKEYGVNKVMETNDEGTLITGYTINIFDEYNPYLIKLDKWGKVEWKHPFSFSLGEVGYDIAEDATGYLLLATGLDSTQTTPADEMYLVHVPFSGKTDAIGRIELTPKNIELYPNPVENLIHIYPNIGSFNYEILNINGSILQSRQSEINDLDVSFLLPGIYLIRIKLNTNQIISKKIIKL